MGLLFYLGGLIIGLFSLTNLIVSLFFFIPTAKRHAPAYRRAVYTNPIMRILYGPVPYGSILTIPLFATALLVIAWLYVRSEWFEYSLIFSAGVVTSGVLGVFALRDKNGKHRRTFNLSWGDEYRTDFFGSNSVSSLRDEQLYCDLPDLVKDARSRLLANEGEHESSPQIISDLNLLSQRYGIQVDRDYSVFMRTQYPELKEGELPDYKRHFVAKEEAYIIPKALISVTVSKLKTGKVVYKFWSTFM